MDQTLEQALEAARTAEVSDRINCRDAIAKHGRAGIEAVTTWLTDPRLGRFAAQVVWKAGDLGERQLAVAVLREAIDDPTVAVSREDTALLLRKLGHNPPAPSAYRRKPSSIPAVAGTGWPGFQAREFETTDGTFWRSRGGRDSMVPHVLRPLRELDPMFESWSIYHSPEVHLAVKDRYEAEGDPVQGFRAAKLVVYAHGSIPAHPDVAPEVVVALYLEKGNGEAPFGVVDARWDWPGFIRLLRSETFCADLERLMAKHALRIGDYWVEGRFYEDATDHRFVGTLDEQGLILHRDATVIGRGWASLADLLEALPEERWQNLHIWRSWPAAEAIAAGSAFARVSVGPVMRDLAAPYLRIVGSHRWSGSSS